MERKGIYNYVYSNLCRGERALQGSYRLILKNTNFFFAQTLSLKYLLFVIRTPYHKLSPTHHCHRRNRCHYHISTGHEYSGHSGR